MGWTTRVQFLAGATFSSPPHPRPALGSTQPPIQWVLGALIPAEKRPGHEVDYLHLVYRLRICGAIPPLHQHVFMA